HVVHFKMHSRWNKLHILNVTLCVCSSSTVEQEQIQKKTFTNWVNAQLAKVSRVSFILGSLLHLFKGFKIMMYKPLLVNAINTFFVCKFG
uniref:Calponin-homology (CH) domain-containing protein n=1 Tax=Cyclopterus lumpus TaxID=8103 RepID=A0A8C2X856_CYCLU